MTDSEKRFINELGNEINVQISEQVIKCVPGIMICIIGPTSEITNHITRMEAQIIYEQLRKVIFNE